MAENSSIEWTDATWNPTTGCTKISPGCAHCYIESTPPFRMAGRKFVNGKIPLEFHDDRLGKPLTWKKPKRIFVNSLSDLFHEDVPDGYIDRVFATMTVTPRHTYQLLTKRADRMADYFSVEPNVLRDRWLDTVIMDMGEDASAFAANFINGWSNPKECPQFDGPADGTKPRWPLPNLWLGVTTENQAAADERIPHLLKVPAAVRFLSCEPLLGPVDLKRHLAAALYRQVKKRYPSDEARTPAHLRYNGPPSPDWVIVGGESGHGARPCDVAWIRSIIAQCKAAEVPVFCKQLGAMPGETTPDGDSVRAWGETKVLKADDGVRYLLKDKKGGDWSEWPEEYRVREFPKGGVS